METTTDTKRKRTVYGTCYFPTYAQALTYYAAQESFPAQAVARKLREGEIHIGKPEAKPGQHLFVQDNRWHIEEFSSGSAASLSVGS